jgi:HD-GYP domain-containing protein (c-di-GMP phosphodiesterase class II)
MDRKREINFNLNNFLLAISESLDFVEIDLLGVTANHSKRVAFIAISLGIELNLSQEDIFDLCAYSILHDNALVNDRENVYFDVDKQLANMKKLGQHCIMGEENIKEFPFVGHHRDVIKYHHEYFNGSGIFGLKYDEIPLLSQLISFADTIDGLLNFSNPSIQNRRDIVEFTEKNRNTLFSEEVCDAFLKISKKTAFWLDLQSEKTLINFLLETTDEFSIELTYEELLSITSIFTKIVDTKSHFTHEHSSGLREKCGIMADFYRFSHKDKMMFLIAASLHDLGKLAISNDILDKPSALSDDEFEVMKSHVYYTSKALKSILEFEDIAKWASNHHEKLDGSGYPYGKDKSQLCFKSRLMGCLDIYQALTEDRPYRVGLEHKESMDILNNLVKDGKLDRLIVKDIEDVFGKDKTQSDTDKKVFECC